MKKIAYYTCFLLMALLAQTASLADVVTLKNGRSLEGEVTDESGGTVVFMMKIGKVKLERKNIASIEKKDLPADFYGVKEEAVKAEVVPSIAAEVPLKAEGYGEASTGKYKLSVSAEMKRLYNGDAILVKYKTSLPQKTILFLEIRALNRVIVTRKQTVEGPSFAIRFGPFEGKRFAPGIYVVEVSCISSRQENREIIKTLGNIGDISASAEIRVGSPDEAEETTHKRMKELVADLKGLGALYNELNLEYAAQQKKFNKERWESFSDGFAKTCKGIRDTDQEYRKASIVMDYSAEENIKISMLSGLEKLRVRYTEELYKSNGLEFKVPPSDDNRDAATLNTAIKDLLSLVSGFIEKSEKGTK